MSIKSRIKYPLGVTIPAQQNIVFKCSYSMRTCLASCWANIAANFLVCFATQQCNSNIPALLVASLMMHHKIATVAASRVHIKTLCQAGKCHQYFSCCWFFLFFSTAIVISFDNELLQALVGGISMPLKGECAEIWYICTGIRKP